MPFLSGSIAFERFRIVGESPRAFGLEHIEALQRFACGQSEMTSNEQVHAGFLAGAHLLDVAFDLEKNVIQDALHFAVRLDTNQVPSAIKRAWMQIELAGLMDDHINGRPTKAQRQQAKEAVEQRCEDEVRTGKYLRMQQFPLLWDARNNLLYFGGSSVTGSEQAAALFARAFDLELDRITSGKIAQIWAEQNDREDALENLAPASFHPQHTGDIAWLNSDSGNYDFLGNEFLMWLWWQLETKADTLDLPDESEVTAMLTKTLQLECPRGESGKETITSESPVKLPEAIHGIRSGKLPRKTGMTLVRHSQQFDLVLQAETFAVGGAKVHLDEDSDIRGTWENRIEAIRHLGETLDLLFHAFCERRVAKAWNDELEKIRRWVQHEPAKAKKPAA